MSRTTHDINLDHYGVLAGDRVDGGFSSATQIGTPIGRYYATESVTDVIRSLDERLTAIANGYNIMAGSLTADAIIRSEMGGSSTADAVIV
jgi:hypothetical protein